jgi:hypothetical protein
MHGVAQRTRDDVWRAGGIFTLAVGVVAAVLILACQPTQTHDELEAQRPIPGPARVTTHLTVQLSRAAIEESDGDAFISIGLPISGIAVSLTPDDATLDADVTESTESSFATLDVSDLDAVCPAEGPCEIGMSVEIAAHDAESTATVFARVTKDLQRGRFTAAATIAVVTD